MQSLGILVMMIMMVVLWWYGADYGGGNNSGYSYDGAVMLKLNCVLYFCVFR